MMRFTAMTLVAFMLLMSGCGSTQMYTHDGFLTEYGLSQTNAEISLINTRCKAYDKIESERYECLRDIIPFRLRTDEVFADLTENWLDASTNVSRGYERGGITEPTARLTIQELYDEYSFQNRMLNEEYAKIVGARNAREQNAYRQRVGNAFSQVGSDLLKQSSSSKSISCTETVPGTVSCSEW